MQQRLEYSRQRTGLYLVKSLDKKIYSYIFPDNLACSRFRIQKRCGLACRIDRIRAVGGNLTWKEKLADSKYPDMCERGLH